MTLLTGAATPVTGPRTCTPGAPLQGTRLRAAHGAWAGPIVTAQGTAVPAAGMSGTGTTSAFDGSTAVQLDRTGSPPRGAPV